MGMSGLFFSALNRFKRGVSGQTTTEYMLVIGVLVLALVFAYWFIAPGLRDGFVELAEKITAQKP